MDYIVADRTILIIEDDLELQSRIAAHFSLHNKVYTATDVDEAARILSEAPIIDALILDLILKSSMGLEIFKCGIPLPPVVILSSLDGDEHIIAGLTSGAADYVTKPCSMELLETRLAMRLLPREKALHAYGKFTLNVATRTVSYDDNELTLTPSEFNVLLFLVRNKGVYYLADELYEHVWGAPSLQTTTIRTHLSSLRRKLKTVAPDVDLIKTEFGRGYCFIGETT